jgi:hypothetical protein
VTHPLNATALGPAVAGVTSRFLQEVDGSWKVRIGPVGRDDMLTVLNGFVW